MLNVNVIVNTKIFLLVTLYVLASAKHEHYVGWKSYFVKVSTVEQVINLNSLRNKLDLDIISPAHVQREGVVLVKPEYQKKFIQKLANLGITFRTHVSDVKSALDQDDEIINDWTISTAREARTMPYNNYQPLNVINAYMERIAESFPNITTLVTAAKTFEGRPIKYMRISTTNFKDKRKPVIVIDGGAHAREWISPPTVTWAINKLTEDVTEPDLLHNYDWILIPVVNPDGYEFTFTDWRLWRKSRVVGMRFYGSLCRGVDINRNYDSAWNTVENEDDQCSYDYPGTHAFSEIESQVVRDVLQEHLPRIILYLSMHSYGNLILHPWAFNKTRSPNYNALQSVGNAITDVFLNLRLPGNSRFIVGSTAVALYKCSGVSADYAHSIGVPLAYTYELPGLSTGAAGFHLNPQYIEEVCLKTWDSIVVGARRARLYLKKQ